MDFVSKDQLKISLARVKSWIENSLSGKADKNGSDSEDFATKSLSVRRGSSQTYSKVSLSPLSGNNGATTLYLPDNNHGETLATKEKTISKSSSPNDYPMADAYGFYDGANDEFYYMMGSEAEEDENPDDAYIIPNKEYVDDAIGGVIPGCNGQFGYLLCTANTTIADNSTATIIRLNTSGSTTLTVTLPTSLTAGRSFIIANDSMSQSWNVATGAQSRRIGKIGTNTSSATAIALAAGKAVWVFAISTTTWRYIELN